MKNIYFSSFSFIRKTSILLLICLFFAGITAVKGQSFTEGFEDVTNLPDWGVLNNSESPDMGWFGGSTNVFNAHQGSAGSYVGCNFESTNALTGATISNWLITPNRNFSNGDVISFYTRTYSNPTDYPDRLEVRLSTNGANTNVGTTSTSVGDFTNLLLTVNPNLTTTGYPNVWTQYTITISGLAGPTSGRIAFRYFVTNGGPNGDNSDYIGIDTYSYTSVIPAPANDNCPGALSLTHGTSCTPVTGNVAGATQSMPACGVDGTANNDVWFSFVAASTGAIVTVDGSADFDAVFQVFSGSCGALNSIACVDNTFEGDVETTTLSNLVVGQTYYVRVYDWYSTIPATTTFTICVEQFTQCSLTQPTGSILETETCGQNLNGGCNMLPATPAYQTLTCGQTVWGTSWANGGSRDTDWFTFTIGTAGTVTWSANTEFNYVLFFADISNCSAPVILASVASNACQATTLSHNFTSTGTYAAIIAPSTFEGYPCGTNNKYHATLTLPSTTPVISAGGSTTICPGGSVALNSTGTGTFQWYNGSSPVGTNSASYNASAAGSYSVELTNNNGCNATSNTINVTVNPLDDATFAYSSGSYCIGGSNPIPTSTVSGTYGSTPAGLVFANAGTGEINLATSTAGTYDISFTTTGACPNSSTQPIVIGTAQDASFSYGSANYCTSSNNPLPVINGTAGTFSSTPTGLDINPTTGEILLSSSTPGGPYTITNTLAASGTCPSASANTTVTILGEPTVTLNPFGIVCDNAPSITLSGGSPSGGTYSGTGVSNGEFSPSVAGGGIHVITYTYTDGNNCTGTASENIEVDICTGMNDAPIAESLLITPNPANEVLNINFSNFYAEKVQINIISAEGRLIYSEQTMVTGSFNRNINLSHFARGLYFIQITYEKELITKKVIVQ
jgi:hypothetical protein